MSETARKVYKYNNRISAYGIKSGILKKLEEQTTTTGESKSQIVADALELYFKNKNTGTSGRCSKHSY